jgi:hypothetical protein
LFFFCFYFFLTIFKFNNSKIDIVDISNVTQCTMHHLTISVKKEKRKKRKEIERERERERESEKMTVGFT